MSASLANRTCETAGCGSQANLQCPTCIKLDIPGSYFCSQECFKGNWSIHKALHKAGQNSNGIIEPFNPWPDYVFTGPLRPHRTSPARTVPGHIQRPDYADHPDGTPLSEQSVKLSSHIKVLNDEEQEQMIIACKLGREVLDEVALMIDVGITTDEIDRVVHEACIEKECYPSPLNYYKYPKSCCTSINEVICHGIPDMRALINGDICNVDVTVCHRGYHGDLNETFFIGNVSKTAEKLVNVTWECLEKAINAVQPGEKYRELGNIIHKHAQSNGFSVVRSYCGHGIHQLFHTSPGVPHYAKNKAVGVMKPGHTFTIEPMISQGSWRDKCWPDNWTAVTVDGLLSAQFEQTLLVTDTGVDILTKRLGNNGLPYFMDKKS
ncbi:methionine aminopeptidase 1 [Rhopalosiphum maidis]|uniref:methionine aminopeptidase 1 n=1 Tax=Rhopalosiphum maidis TaxID=43146 RepID=UPI000F00E0FA|nr:methionine aminopeptidase 1 [Rhopalosiphum maidis]